MKPYLVLLLALSGSALAADSDKPDPAKPDAGMAMSHPVTRAATTTWGPAPPMLPPGAQAAVLVGDPGQAGVFTLRLKMPAGYRVPRHWHPTDEAVTLIEGDLILSMGAADAANDEALSPGDFVNLPAKMHHMASSKGGAVVQIQSVGPFEINYIDPKDDPRNAGKAGTK